MAAPAKNKYKNKWTGSRVVLLVILFLVIAVVAAYFWRASSDKSTELPQKPASLTVKPQAPPPPEPQNAKPETAVQPQPQNIIKDKNRTALPADDSVKPGAGDGRTARMAIIIDDMGGSVAEARSLAAIKVPLTFAIIPGLRSDKDVASYAAANKIETMIHIPMQSKGWPSRRLEANGLLVEMPSDELQERVTGFVRRFPGAVGVNNHMGSEFTENEEKMTAVLKTMKNNNLFFVDSVTSPESVGLMVAQRIGVRSARRNVFLDNEQERSYIAGQINQAVRYARRNGSAIAICHPHPVTISTLAAVLPGLASQGVNLVTASQLVR